MNTCVGCRIVEYLFIVEYVSIVYWPSVCDLRPVRGCVLSTIFYCVSWMFAFYYNEYGATFSQMVYVPKYSPLWEVNVLRNINPYLLPHMRIVSAFAEVNILHSKHLIYRFILIPITNSNNTSEIPITKYKLQLSIPYRNKSMQTGQP